MPSPRPPTQPASAGPVPRPAPPPQLHPPRVGSAPRQCDGGYDHRIRAVFTDFNSLGTGAVSYNEFGCGFRDCGIDFAHATVDELWSKADADGDGVVTWEEWQAWARVFPNLVECVYHRGAGNTEMGAVREHARRAESEVASLLERESQLNAEMEQIRSRLAEARLQQRQAHTALSDARSRAGGMSHQERDLVENEIRMERQRDQLRLQRAKFDASASLFDHQQTVEGSPRRAHASPL
eukprot:TRINITY_DN9091_c0_g1_i1.p1 TRINITY_DN9091_c0_g1~~TRINITY_DN9091_c0_g1_i1.p1  ORF type:complete len:238 (+),score=74.00 TRINITY_DN9091_c0_g1_i1:480-1193(+)